MGLYGLGRVSLGRIVIGDGVVLDEGGLLLVGQEGKGDVVQSFVGVQGEFLFSV